MRPALVLGALLVLGGCASSTGFHWGRSALGPEERAFVARAPAAPGRAFRRVWKTAGPAGLGLLKWSEGTSSTVADAPGELLQAIRDETGRLNRVPRSGPEASLTITIYRFEKRWWGPTEMSYEVVIRDPGRNIVCVADDLLRPPKDLRASLADSEVDLLARAVARKLRQELGL
jgi:hypothetical protein